MKQTKEFKMDEWRKLEKIVEDFTGFHFKNEDLLKQAFVRKSYSSQFGGENNENLELLGDSVLNFQVMKALHKKYGYIKTSINLGFDGEMEYSTLGSEGDFTQLKSRIVSNKALAEIIDRTGLIDYLIVGKSDALNEVDKLEKVKGDLFEAIVGAIAIQCDLDDKTLESVICKMLKIDELLKVDNNLYYKPKELTLENAVNVLKELAEKGKCSMPAYEDVELRNLKTNQPVWGCNCTVASWGQFKQVLAHSKKDAKKCAAYLILISYFNMPNDYGPKSCNRITMHSWAFEDGNLILEKDLAEDSSLRLH